MITFEKDEIVSTDYGKAVVICDLVTEHGEGILIYANDLITLRMLQSTMWPTMSHVGQIGDIHRNGVHKL